MDSRPRPLLRVAGWVTVLAFLMLAWSAIIAGEDPKPDPLKQRRAQLPVKESIDVPGTLRLVDAAQRAVKRRSGGYTGDVNVLAREDDRIGDRARWVGLQLQANPDGASYLAVARQVRGTQFVSHLIGRTDKGELVRSTGKRRPLTDWKGR